MKKIFPYFLTLIPLFSMSQTFDLDRDWGTYFGDERFIYRDSKIDTEHNLYVAGYVLGGLRTFLDPETGEEIGVVDYGDVTENFNYFTNAPHQSVHAGGGADGFIAKFSPEGSLLWATFFGGERVDFIESMDIDPANNIYIYGSTNSTTGISTAGAYQEEKSELFDLFLAKFTSQGTLVWSTYYGGEENEQTTSSHNGTSTQKEQLIIHDGNHDLYLSSSWLSSNLITQDEEGPTFLIKFTDSGQPVWARAYGINGSAIIGLAFCSNALFVAGHTNDTPSYPNFINTYFASEGAFQSTQGGGFFDAFLAKFNAQGERVWGTYFGGSSVELLNFNPLVCKDKFLYLGGRTHSNGMATNDAFQTEKAGLTPFLAKFEDNISQENGLVPIREWSTYYGLGVGEVDNIRPISVTVDHKGAVYLSGNTGLTENIASEGAWQDSPIAGIRSGFLAKFNAQGSRAWGTYYRGENHSQWEKVLPYEANGHDKFYLTGVTLSNTGMATEGALQPERQIFDETFIPGQNFGIFIAHFSPSELSVGEFSWNTIMLYPNPNQGSFTLKLESFEAEAELLMYDVQGRQVHQQKVYAAETFVTTSGLSEGVYFLKLVIDHKAVYAGKINIKY